MKNEVSESSKSDATTSTAFLHIVLFVLLCRKGVDRSIIVVLTDVKHDVGKVLLINTVGHMLGLEAQRHLLGFDKTALEGVAVIC